MMKSTISQRDWQTLSEYLDNELPDRQVSRLEDRLAKESELKKALDELQRTRLLLRYQAKLRAPHNFTLTPAMVNRRVRSHTMSISYPAVRFATMMVIVLLVVVLAGDGWYSLSAYRNLSMSALNQPEAAAEMAFQMDMNEQSVEQPVEEAALAEAAVAETAVAEAPEMPNEAAPSARGMEPATTDAPLAKSMAEPPVEGTAVPAEGGDMLKSEAPSTFMQEDNSSETADLSEKEADQPTGPLENATDSGQAVGAGEAEVPSGEDSTVPRAGLFFNPIRILILSIEIALAILVLILGMIVYRLRSTQ